VRAWGVSLAVHAVALGLGAALWPKAPTEPEPDSFRWEVAFTPAAQPPLAEPTPPKPPPKPAVRKPDPPPPERPIVPKPAPEPSPTAPAAAAPEPAVITASAPAAAPAASEAPARAPTVVPKPAPPVDAAAEAERRWYAALVDRLREMKRYPLPARRLGQEGVVVLAVQVAPDGRLVSVEVRKGSGHPLLDRDAVRLLEDAAEAARGSLHPERSARLEIPIAYRLEAGKL